MTGPGVTGTGPGGVNDGGGAPATATGGGGETGGGSEAGGGGGGNEAGGGKVSGGGGVSESGGGGGVCGGEESGAVGGGLLMVGGEMEGVNVEAGFCGSGGKMTGVCGLLLLSSSSLDLVVAWCLKRVNPSTTPVITTALTIRMKILVAFPT